MARNRDPSTSGSDDDGHALAQPNQAVEPRRTEPGGRRLVCPAVTDGPVTVSDDGVVIAVWAVPGSSRAVIDGEHGGRLKIRVTAPAEGGRANRELAELLSMRLGTTVTLKTGMRGRAKVFEVSPANIETVRRKLGV